MPRTDPAPEAHAIVAIAARLRAAGCVFAEDEAALILESAAGQDAVAAMVERRAAGEPLEYVVGWAEFRGLRIAVEPGVFVPRRRTEVLAGEAVALAGRAAGRPVVVDLCCGSGAIGAAVAAAVPGIELHAADADPVAVRCARRNIGAAGRAYTGDLYAALPDDLRGRVTVLAANVPYVPAGEIALLPAEARDHEPRATLDGGADGLDLLRRVVADAPRWLAPGGALLTEASERQAPSARAVVAGAGLVPRVRTDDDLGATVVIGTFRG